MHERVAALEGGADNRRRRNINSAGGKLSAPLLLLPSVALEKHVQQRPGAREGEYGDLSSLRGEEIEEKIKRDRTS